MSKSLVAGQNIKTTSSKPNKSEKRKINESERVSKGEKKRKKEKRIKCKWKPTLTIQFIQVPIFQQKSCKKWKRKRGGVKDAENNEKNRL